MLPVARGRWSLHGNTISPIKISTLIPRTPAREIVELFLTRNYRGEMSTGVIGELGGRADGLDESFAYVAVTTSQLGKYFGIEH